MKLSWKGDDTSLTCEVIVVTSGLVKIRSSSASVRSMTGFVSSTLPGVAAKSDCGGETRRRFGGGEIDASRLDIWLFRNDGGTVRLCLLSASSTLPAVQIEIHTLTPFPTDATRPFYHTAPDHLNDREQIEA